MSYEGSTLNIFQHSKSSKYMLTFLLVAILAFPNAFSIYKMGILALISGLIFFALIKSDIKSIDTGTVYFYLIFSLISSVWILRGMVIGGHEKAFYDAFKLYVLYSPMLCFLIVALQNGRYLDVMFRSFFISAWIIVFINLTSLSEVFFGFQFFPDWFREEMSIGVGIHEGYTDVSADNINSLFFIIPVIYVMSITKQSSLNYSKLSMYSVLALTMFVALVSGRRALIMLLFIVPFLFEIHKRICFLNCKDKVITIRWLPIVFLLGFPFIIIGPLYFMNIIDMTSLIDNFTSLLDSDTERSVQFYSLLNGFYDKYLLGSGFGGSVEVIRNTERPWTYELTYVQLLFNGGLIGSCLVFTLIVVYYYKALTAIRRFDSFKTEALAILTGIVIFCIAASSNPYFSSFDSLFLLGTFPLLSGWHAYFTKNASK